MVGKRKKRRKGGRKEGRKEGKEKKKAMAGHMPLILAPLRGRAGPEFEISLVCISRSGTAKAI